MTENKPTPPHDLPAAKLRDALQRAEKRNLESLAELDEVTAKLTRADNKVAELERDLVSLAAECSEFESRSLELEYGDQGTIQLKYQRDALRAELDEARQQLAALHPLADGYAGLLAEKVKANA